MQSEREALWGDYGSGGFGLENSRNLDLALVNSHADRANN